MTTQQATTRSAHVDDRHERYRVRWNDHHESILYPADGVVITSRRRRARHAGV